MQSLLFCLKFYIFGEFQFVNCLVLFCQPGDNGNVLLISSDSRSIPNSPARPSPLSLIKVSSLTSDLKITDWDETSWSCHSLFYAAWLAAGVLFEMWDVVRQSYWWRALTTAGVTTDHWPPDHSPSVRQLHQRQNISSALPVNSHWARATDCED